jgi:DNA-binding LacI/PurR family transcriptional regulator
LEEPIKGKNITIYDIANEIGVSAATVSRAISGKGYVSEANKEKILALAEQYNFRPNTFAQNLQSGFTKTIGFMVPHIGNMYFANVYYEFEKWASGEGYMTILLNAKDNRELESKLLYSLNEKRVDGIVIMGGRLDDVKIKKQYINEITELNQTIPCLLCSSRADIFGCPGVHGDDKMGMDLILRHLHEKGYKNVVLIGGSDHYIPTILKKQAAISIAEEIGMNLKVKWFKEVFSYEAGYRSMEKILEQKPYPDVVCCINDYVAAGALTAAIKAGLRVPEDIAITGHDNVEASWIMPTQITTAGVNYDKYGKMVFDQLFESIQKHGKLDSKVSLIEPKLVVREST